MFNIDGITTADYSEALIDIGDSNKKNKKKNKGIPNVGI